jgi:hypothetical protein
MDNPFELPAPSHPLERIHTFARDLAYGALLSYWRPGLTTAYYGDGSIEFMLHPPYNEAEVEKFTSKWSEDRRPNFETLRSFNYLSTESESPGQRVYTITHQAFKLLEQPLAPPSVFISYKRGVSSPFGLAIEYRLEARGIRPFIDRSLEGGDQWKNVLQARVRESRYFVCLISEEAVESDHVRAEIQWALDGGTMIIPIWNKGFNADDLAKYQLERLTAYNAIIVMGDRAEDYHNAVEKLLNRLGYAAPVG